MNWISKPWLLLEDSPFGIFIGINYISWIESIL